MPESQLYSYLKSGFAEHFGLKMFRIENHLYPGMADCRLEVKPDHYYDIELKSVRLKKTKFKIRHSQFEFCKSNPKTYRLIARCEQSKRYFVLGYSGMVKILNKMEFKNGVISVSGLELETYYAKAVIKNVRPNIGRAFFGALKESLS